MHTATILPSVKPTLARKFDAVHKITVNRRRMIPIVCRQTPRIGFCCGGGLLSEELRGLCEHEESVDLLSASKLSEGEAGTGMTESFAGAGRRGRLIAATDASKMDVACCQCASGSSSLPPLLRESLPDPWSCEDERLATSHALPTRYL